MQSMMQFLRGQQVGLLAEQVRWAIAADDMKSVMDRHTSDCEIVVLDLVETWK